MKRSLLTLLLLIILLTSYFPVSGQPPGNKNAQIELPSDMEVSSKQRSVKITAKTEAADLNWVVIGTAPGVETQWDDVGNKSIRVYPNDVDDEILIIVYGTLNMKATAPVSMLIKVHAGGLPPEPKKPDPGVPDPGPGPKSGRIAAHATFVVDNSKLTAETTAVLNDANLRKWIADAGIRLHSPVDVRSEVITRPKGLGPAVQSAGGPPAVVIQDIQGNIIGHGKLTSAAAVRGLLLPHTK